MSVRIVRLGSPRAADEGTRLGTVRRPPRGVPRKDFARLDWYDVWYPVLAPLERYGFVILFLVFFVSGRLGASITGELFYPMQSLLLRYLL